MYIFEVNSDPTGNDLSVVAALVVMQGCTRRHC